jgi:dTMP kinase
MKKGKLIVFEGIDYSGKGTQIGFTRGTFQNSVWTREPGGTPEAEEIRNFLLSEEGGKISDFERLELFFKSRKIHLEQKVVPAIEKGIDVISDRFDASSFAYQVKTPELRKLFWELRAKIVEGQVKPHYLFLDITPEESLNRRNFAKGRDLNHFDAAAYEEVRDRRDRYFDFFNTLEARVSEHVYRVDGSENIHQLAFKIKTIIQNIIYN